MGLAGVNIPAQDERLVPPTELARRDRRVRETAK
jgi:hypothetical protein